MKKKEGTRELPFALVRGSAVPAAAVLGDKRNLSFRAVWFQMHFPRSSFARGLLISSRPCWKCYITETTAVSPLVGCLCNGDGFCTLWKGSEAFLRREAHVLARRRTVSALSACHLNDFVCWQKRGRPCKKNPLTHVVRRGTGPALAPKCPFWAWPALCLLVGLRAWVFPIVPRTPPRAP